jgi:hypothetical protein
VQSGFYLDFFFKKISEIFIRNVFVYSSLFFGEKYLIEVLTKKIFENFIFNTNKFISFKNLKLNFFFFSVINVLFLIVVLINILFIVF